MVAGFMIASVAIALCVVPLLFSRCGKEDVQREE